MRPPATLLLLALLTTPLAHAWPWDPVTIAVAPGHAGEVRQYEERTPEGARTLLVRLEGARVVADRFGVPRDAETYRSDWLEANGTLASSTVCHQLSGGNVSVRTEPLMGYGGESFASVSAGIVPLGGATFEHDWSIEALFFGFPCEGWSPLAGRSFTEGDTLGLREAGFPFDGAGAETRSAPAEAVDFHGRAALRFVFDGRQLNPELPEGATGHFAVTYADGLPGPVRLAFHAEHEGETEDASLDLVGFEAGAGAPYAPFAGATLPERNPAADFEPHARFAVPDAAYAFPYSSTEALASLLADPRVGLKAWLDAHPDAVLASAYYTRDGRGAGPEGVGTPQGMWGFEFVSGSEGYGAATARTKLADGPAGPLAQPPLLDQWGGPTTVREPAPAAIAPETMTSASLAALGAAQGFPPQQVREFRYSLHLGATFTAAPGAGNVERVASPVVQLTTADRPAYAEGETKARHLDVDAAAAAVQMVYRTRTATDSTSPLDPLPGIAPLDEDDEVSALAALAGPGVGVGLGVGAAATGLALLVVAAKFLLVPLFTRLVRARLLDNPVRARLYERVRAEPGIRQAELVDFLGVGEGAARHHLAQLVRHRFVVESREGAVPTYYAAGEVPPDVARRAAVLRSPSARRVYDAFAASPGMSLREAAARLDMRAPSVHRQKRKLEEAGLLPAAPVAASASP